MLLLERLRETYLPSLSASVFPRLPVAPALPPRLLTLSLTLYALAAVLVGWAANHIAKEAMLLKVGEGSMTIDNDFVLLPAELAALTVKVDVPSDVGVPEITPSGKSAKPSGNDPLSCVHVMGVSPVAVSLWLYAIITFPFGNDVVVITGAMAMVYSASNRPELFMPSLTAKAFTVVVALILIAPVYKVLAVVGVVPSIV